jgi:hypothetical protein
MSQFIIGLFMFLGFGILSVTMILTGFDSTFWIAFISAMAGCGLGNMIIAMVMGF